MSLIVQLTYTGEGENAKLFAKEMMERGIVDMVRAEEGCLRYEYYFSAERENEVMLVDAWTSQEAIDYHHTTESMRLTRELIQKYHLTVRKERLTEFVDKI